MFSKEGDRVECLRGYGWIPGTIVDIWFDNDGEVVPYCVIIDDGSFCGVPADDDECIRKSSKPPPQKVTKSDKLRLKVGDRAVCNVDDAWIPGVIMETFYEHSELGLFPYYLKLDDGREICVPYVDDWFIRQSTSGPMVVEFIVGERVDCQLAYGGNEWVPGTILLANDKWEENIGLAPYAIKFDNGEERVYWGPQECIRASKAPPLSSTCETLNLRFRIGERVECRTPSAFLPGTVIRLWYGKNEFDNDHTVPYQIQLDMGPKIFAPYDDDRCIRQSTVPAPDCWICFDDKQSESNVIVRDCVCRGEGAGFAHTDCLTKLATSKTENLGCNTPIGENDVNPFTECVTCKQRFGVGSCSRVTLAEACFAQHSRDPIGSWWNMEATQLMAESLIGNCDYEGAKRLLQTQIEAVQGDVELEAYLHIELLLQLAEVYYELGQLDEMKSALDKSRSFAEKNSGIKDIIHSHAHRLLANFAKHAHLTGDRRMALKYYEDSARLLAHDGVSYAFVLLHCAALDLELGNKKKCNDRLNEVLKIYVPLHGKDSNINHEIVNAICQVSDGSIEKLPLGKLGLRVLERNIRRLSKLT